MSWRRIQLQKARKNQFSSLGCKGSCGIYSDPSPEGLTEKMNGSSLGAKGEMTAILHLSELPYASLLVACKETLIE